MAGHYTLTGEFQLLNETQGTLYNVGISDVELSSDATKGQGILLRSGETQAFKGTIYARSYDESAAINVQDFIELPGGGDSGGGGGGGTPYTLPTMAQNVKGGAKVGAGLSMTGEVLSLSPIYVPSAVVSQTATGAILTVSDHNGTTTASIKSGADGTDGETPTISTDSIEGGNSVTFGTSAGFWTINIFNGADGAAGVSPTVAAETITGGNAVTFTSAAGMTTINIMDGTPGANGIGVTMTTDSIEGGTALKMHSASGFVTVNVYNGKDGLPGADGKSFEIKAQYASYEALIAAHPTGSAGDAYLVGDDTNPDLYIWLSDDSEWQNSGPIAGIVGPQGPKGDDGVSARVAISSIVGGNRVTFTDGAGAQTMDILNGVNGVSPSVSVATITGGHSVTFTDATTTQAINILDGAAGEDGDSVTFALETVTGGNRVTLTDANGSSSFTVLNGEDGEDGASLSATVSSIPGGHSVSITGGTDTTSFNVYDGTDGANGVSPIVSFSTIPDGHVMTVSDAQGQKQITIMDGSGTGGSVVEYDCVGVISWQHTLRANCLKLDGATVTASDYPQLLQYVQDNNLTVTAAEWESNCVMYVYDSGNDTLKLPDLTGRVPWGVVNNPRSIEAGLPNIEGEVSWLGCQQISADGGALYKKGTTTTGYGHNTTGLTSEVAGFDASRSNSIYGGSNTVQPPAAGLIPQVRYASDMLSAVVPLYRKNSQSYAVGDVVLSANLPTYLRLQCITAGTTASVEPSFSGVTPGQYITDGTAKWVIDDIRDGTPVGRVVFDSILRPGYVRANGATITSASVNYPRLIAFLQANPSLLASDAAAQAANLGLFLYDSGTDTLTMCNYIGKYIAGGESLSELSSTIANHAHVTPGQATFNSNIYTTLMVSTWAPGVVDDISTDPEFGAGYSKGENIVSRGSTQSDTKYVFKTGHTIYDDAETTRPASITHIPQVKY